MTVRIRLTCGFSFIFALLFIIVALGSWRLHTTKLVTDHMVDIVMTKERLVSEWATSTNLNGARTMAVAESANEQRNEQMQGKIRQTTARISEIQKLLDGFEQSQTEVEMIEEIRKRRKAYIDVRDHVFVQKKSNEEQARQLVQSTLEPALNAYVEAISKLTTYQTRAIAGMRDQVDDIQTQSQRLLISLGLGAALLGVAVAVAISRSIVLQLGGEPTYTANVTGRIAQGDLSTQIDLHEKDRASLLFSIRKMRDSLATIVAEVRSGTDAIATASNQVAAGNVDLASRTEAQASALEKTASSVEELISMIRQNADHAHQANEVARSASTVANQGGAVVAEVVSTMASINESAKRIADIIGVIDGIAFQTNILALNAAVEAARAGEQGRGFAVVASEVRALAQRSASAAKEIKSLISDSVAKVQTGSTLVNQAGKTMEDVVRSIGQVTGIMAEINVASREQILGIEEISTAISQMDSVTQQNASLVEEAAAASEALNDQATALAGLVRVFQLVKG